MASEVALGWQIADGLIVPRPWLDDHMAQYGRSAHSLRAAARSLSIPIQSIYTVLTTKSSKTADQVHAHVRAVTGYPWFLPPDIRDHHPPDQW